MNMKIFCKPVLWTALAALLGLSAPALARDNLGYCYGPVMAHIDRSLIKPPERELFILLDQTVRFDKKLAANLKEKTGEFIRPGDKITIVSFSANSNGNFTELVFTGALERSLPEKALSSTPMRQIKAYKKCMQAQAKNGKPFIMKSMFKALTLPDDNYDFTNTELIGTINMLARDLINKSEIKDRTLLVYSDMLENSALTTHFTKGNIRKISPKAEMAKVKKAKMIPDLSGTKVYVIGGGWTGEGKPYLESRKLNALRAFWEAFFTKSGSRLEGFGQPVLLTELH
jgi:hypothetical protein